MIYYITDLFNRFFQYIINIFKRFLTFINNNKESKWDNKHTDFILNKYKNKKIKIGLLTNEIPPIVYGVATWIVNFLEMFENDDKFEVIPIFLYQDKLPKKL